MRSDALYALEQLESEVRNLEAVNDDLRQSLEAAEDNYDNLLDTLRSLTGYNGGVGDSLLYLEEKLALCDELAAETLIRKECMECGELFVCQQDEDYELCRTCAISEVIRSE